MLGSHARAARPAPPRSRPVRRSPAPGAHADVAGSADDHTGRAARGPRSPAGAAGRARVDAATPRRGPEQPRTVADLVRMRETGAPSSAEPVAVDGRCSRCYGRPRKTAVGTRRSKARRPPGRRLCPSSTRRRCGTTSRTTTAAGEGPGVFDAGGCGGRHALGSCGADGRAVVRVAGRLRRRGRRGARRAGSPESCACFPRVPRPLPVEGPVAEDR